MGPVTRGPLRSLSHRSYRVLWITFFVTQTGFWMSTVALQWVTARLTDSDAFMLGLLYFFNLIPLLLFSPIGGNIADRFDRKRVVMWSQGVVAVLAGALVVSLTVTEDSVVPLFVFAFGVGTMLAMLGPANTSVMANAVPLEDLPSAISLQSVAMNVSRMAGPAVATPLLLAYGARPAFLAYLATSLFTVVALSRIRVRKVDLVHDGLPMHRRIAAGYAHARERRPAFLGLTMVGVTALFGSSYAPLLPVYAFDVLDGGDVAFTMLFVMSGLGALIGGFVTGMGDRPPSVVGVAGQMVAMAVALGAFALSRHIIASYVLVLVVAGLNFAVMTSLNTMIQFLIDEDMRGRVMSLYILAWGGLIPVGALVIGWLANLIGPTTAIVGFAAVVVCYAGLVLGRAGLERRRGTVLT